MTALMLMTLAAGMSIKVGEEAPDFSLLDTEGQQVTLSGSLEKGPVILAFFPQAFTPGCTRELSSYSDQYGEVEKKGAQLIAVSTDDWKTQKRFKESVKAPYTLLSDPDGKVSRMYTGNAEIPDGNRPRANRATFVIDTDLTIRQIVTGDNAIDPSASIASCPNRERG
jgi:peroxiredoxin Q/BCP